MTFLPENHKEPSVGGNYTKLTEGSHKLRIASSAIVGYEEWQEEGGVRKPVRYRVGQQPPFGKDGKELKYFWAFVVYNYELERVQVMEVTQKSIRSAIEDYVSNDAWGDPKGYDLVITRKGTTLSDTEYSVVANPHSDMPEEVQKAVAKTYVNLEALYDGADPFEVKPDEAVKKANEEIRSQEISTDDIPFGDD